MKQMNEQELQVFIFVLLSLIYPTIKIVRRALTHTYEVTTEDIVDDINAGIDKMSDDYTLFIDGVAYTKGVLREMMEKSKARENTITVSWFDEMLQSWVSREFTPVEGKCNRVKQDNTLCKLPVKDGGGCRFHRWDLE